MQVPAGYRATILAEPPQVIYPTAVKVTPEGVLFVSVDLNASLGTEPGRGKVLQMIDTDGDGTADECHNFIPGINSPRGLEWDGDWLYVLHPPHLTAWCDTNGDHVADASQRLVSDLSFGLDQRPADHTANGITLGIDGWLYLAIGDFGIPNARGTDGAALRHRGGCVARVRPDGTGLHLFSRGTRNIYGIAVSPTLEAIARDNTNDGGGWDVRLHRFTGLDHHGYPSLFRHFPEDTVAPIADYGGGSGTGALWLDEPEVPAPLRNVALTADWGRGMIYRHELVAAGASLREIAQHDCIAIPRPVALDVDASGALYLASWKDGRFQYDGEKVGFLARVTPPGWKPAPVPDFSKLSAADLISQFRYGSHRIRLAAQRELLRRKDIPIPALETLAQDDSAPLPARTAAVFVVAQIQGQAAFDSLARIAENARGDLVPLAIRALGDRPEATDHKLFRQVASATDPALLRELLVAIVRTGSRDGDLMRGVLKAAAHDDPLVALTAVEGLARLDAYPSCLKTIDDKDLYEWWPGAFHALARMHRMEVVNGIIDRLKKSNSALFRAGALKALARLYFREGPWNGEEWGVRPDTSGPYFHRIRWEGADAIDPVLRQGMRDKRVNKTFLLNELSRNHFKFSNFNELLSMTAVTPEMESATVDLIVRRETPPDDSLPFLTFLATNEERPGDLRLRAAIALAHSQDDMGVAEAFRLALVRDEIDAIPQLREELLEALLKNPTHERRCDWLLEEAHGKDEPAGVLAWSILLNLTRHDSISPVTEEEIDRAIAHALTSNSLHIRLLRAIAESVFHPREDIVRTSLRHTDPAVAAAAIRAAEALHLSPDAPARDAGPKIANLTLEQVTERVCGAEADPKLGAALFVRQTCDNCHTLTASEPQKGPYLGNIGNTYTRAELVEAILKPGRSIAKGFATHEFTLDDGRTITGYVAAEAADAIEVRDAAGKVTVIDPARIIGRRTTEISTMPERLADSLTPGELAAIIAYLESLGGE